MNVYLCAFSDQDTLIAAKEAHDWTIWSLLPEKHSTALEIHDSPRCNIFNCNCNFLIFTQSAVAMASYVLGCWVDFEKIEKDQSQIASVIMRGSRFSDSIYAGLCLSLKMISKLKYSVFFKISSLFGLMKDHKSLKKIEQR